jgi:hypothetical protein
VKPGYEEHLRRVSETMKVSRNGLRGDQWTISSKPTSSQKPLPGGPLFGSISKVSGRPHLQSADLSAASAQTPRGKAWWFLLLTSPVGSTVTGIFTLRTSEGWAAVTCDRENGPSARRALGPLSS